MGEPRYQVVSLEHRSGFLFPVDVQHALDLIALPRVGYVSNNHRPLSMVVVVPTVEPDGRSSC